MDRISIGELDNFIGIYFGQDYDLFEPSDEIEPKISQYIKDSHKGNHYALVADIDLFLSECTDIEKDFKERYKHEFVPANWHTTAKDFLSLVHKRVLEHLKNYN